MTEVGVSGVYTVADSTPRSLDTNRHTDDFSSIHHTRKVARLEPIHTVEVL